MIFLVILVLGCSQTKEGELSQILNTGSEFFQETLNNPKHEIQIIYGKIESDTIIHQTFNVDPNNFFYPASTVKMPVAFAAVQKLEERGFSIDSKILIDSSEHNPRQLTYDSLFNEEPSAGNLINKIFTFSDNQAYNILYGWLGKDYINQLNQDLGLSSSRIIHQLSESAFSFTQESNRNTFNVTLVDGDTSVNFQSAPTTFVGGVVPNNQLRGVGYQKEGEIINEPFDFSQKNFISLPDLLGCLERVVKPELFEESQRYSYSQSTYEELEKIMLLRPNDLPSPIDTLQDNYVKFFIYGDQESGAYPDHIEIRNKVGWAYGYLTDVAHIRDTKKNIEFFLAATIHVNENQIYNDGKYEYEEIGVPFLAELGRLIYDYNASLSK